MKVEELYEKCICENCDEYTYTFEIRFTNGLIALRLCKKCLLELFKGIVER